MARVFICYRREDSAGHAGRLRDALAARLAGWQIFRDLDAIGPGEDFVRAMSREIASCDVFLAVIGNHWLTAAHGDGMRRLDDPDDHVRREVSEALARGVRVIPVLVAGASMPRAADLAEPLRGLATRNAITLDDEGWDFDVERLTAAIDPERRTGESPVSGGASPRSLRGAAVSPRRTHPFQDKQRLAAVILAAVGLVTIVAVSSNRSPENAAPAERRTSTPGTEPTSGQGKSAVERATGVPGSSAGATAPPGAAIGERQATLPMGGEAEMGGVLYEIIDAKVVTDGGGSAVALRVRSRNTGAYDMHLHAGLFRLVQGEEVRAPTTALSEIVPAQTAKDATVAFELPAADVADGTLRIVQGDETAEIPLDLSGRRGATAATDREGRRAGRTTFPVAIDPARAAMSVETLACELRAATVHRYAHKLALALKVRVHNRGRYDVAISDGMFRLAIDGMPRAPVRRFSEVVRAEESGEYAVVFDVPFEARNVVVRTRLGEKVVELPLQIPPGAAPGRAIERTAGH